MSTGASGSAFQLLALSVSSTDLTLATSISSDRERVKIAAASTLKAILEAL
jgi:hypothetical protein